MPSNTILAQMSVLISGQTAQFNAALNASRQQLSLFQRSVQGAGTAVAGYFGATTIFRGLEAGIGIIADFEFKMAEVAAITGATGEELKKLSDNARELGRSTLYTAEQVAGLEVELGRLGFSTPEILAASKAAILLATATGEDLAKATAQVGTSIRQFALPAEEAGHLVDVMAGAFNKTGLALDDFSVAMSYAGPQASAAGISFEETAALLGILANSGIKASTAGTSLRRIIADLAKDSRPLSEKLAELAKKGITVQGALDEVGRIAATSLIILERGAGQIEPLSKELRDGVGEGARVAAIRMDTLIGDTEKLKGAFSNLILEGSGVTVALRFVEQGLTNILNGITDDKVSKFAKFTALIAAMAGDTGGLQILGQVEKSLNEEQKKLTDSAQKLFDAYNHGFSDSEKAAESFLKQQYLLLNQAQTNRAESSKTFKGDEDGLKARNAQLDAEIKLRKAAIEVANAYIRAETLATDIVAKVGPRTIGVIEAEIAAQKDLKSSVLANSGAYEQWAQKLDVLEKELARVETRYVGLTGAAARAAAAMRTAAPSQDFNMTATLNKSKSETLFTGSAAQTNVIQKSLEDLTKLNDAAKKAADDGLFKVSKALQGGSAALVEFDSKNQQVIVNLAKVLQPAIVGFAQSIGNAIAGVGHFGDRFLESVAAFAVQFGELLIAAALASKAFQESLATHPYIALAAGIALVALGTAAGAALRKSQKGVDSQAQVSSGSRGQLSALSASSSGGTTEFQIRGEDLYVVLSNYQNNKNG